MDSGPVFGSNLADATVMLASGVVFLCAVFRLAFGGKNQGDLE